jgi:methionyl-tRNA formyltransferase
VKILFFGSSDFSVPFIEAINGSCHSITLVLTSADKAKGRGKIMGPNPVKLCAQKLHLDYLEDLGFSEQTMEKIAGTCFDCLVVVSFGRLIPKKILEIAGGRTINVHPSLLPKYRGPSPITTALLNGDTQTGISLIKIEEKFDIGDVYAQLKFDISENDNRGLLEAKIFKLGAPFLISLLDNFENISLTAHPQSVQGVSYTKIFTKEDFKIDWAKSAYEIFNKIRAFSPTPGSVAFWRGKYLKILKAQIVELPQYSKAEIMKEGQNKHKVIHSGQVISAEKTILLVACGSSVLKPGIKTRPTAISLLVIKPQGKEKMHFNDFINGYRVKPGDFFE